MGAVPPRLTFFLALVSGWVHHPQLIVIKFLQAENRVLRKRLHGERIRFTDEDRAFLGRRAKAGGRKVLLELDTIVTPDTPMRWHRRLVARRWHFNGRRRPGRPGIMRETSQLIVRMAVDNPGWRGWQEPPCRCVKHSFDILDTTGTEFTRSVISTYEGLFYGMLLRSDAPSSRRPAAGGGCRLGRRSE